ncbi:MAG: endonuclease/exonuclease/phosphatase family protein [Byssovorax sp.]
MVERYVQRLLKLKHDYVVALQECPDSADQVLLRTGGYAFGNGGLVLLSSQPLRECELHTRFVMGVISFAGLDVAVFNYHGRSRKELPFGASRGGYASEYRWVFDHLAGTRDIIVLGDFNACPGDLEISHRACFSFHRMEHEPQPRTLKSHHDSPRKDMRFVAPPDEVGATYIHDTGEGAVQKLVYDYVAANVEIARQLRRVEVVKDLEGISLGSSDGRPILSDHFPVRARWGR